MILLLCWKWKNTTMFEVVNSCRSCGNEHLSTIFDLGMSPLADVFLWDDQLAEDEITAPL